VPITFQGDPMQPNIDTFTAQLATASSYWTAAISEYGVGPLTASSPQHLSAMDFTTDADVQTWLGFEINNEPGMAHPDTNTLYVIYMPEGAYLEVGTGLLCGTGPGGVQGYHAAYPFLQDVSVVYAVVGRCAPSPGTSAMDQVSLEATREIIGAATDPLPVDAPAFEVDADHVGWEMAFGNDVGALCASGSGITWVGVTNLVSRAWSNASAAAGHDPCQPQGLSPYFNSAPALGDTIPLAAPFSGTTTGVSVPLGSSKTVDVNLYSDGPTSGPWTVAAVDLTSVLTDAEPALSLSLDKTEGQNGDTVHLTIAALSASSLGVSPFQIVSTLGASDAGGARTTWVGIVGN
jgi:hypothetical protein